MQDDGERQRRQQEKGEALVRGLLLTCCGDNPEREGLQDTPARVYKAWRHWCAGVGQDPKSLLKTFADGAERYDEMVVVANIPIYSHCEHHLAPFFGKAHIGYLPRNRIVGLSKLARVAQLYARRLQVQERLTRQIAEAIQECLDPLGVGVLIECRHLCMESRGVNTPGAITLTSSLLGVFREDQRVRSEFLSLRTGVV